MFGGNALDWRPLLPLLLTAVSLGLGVLALVWLQMKSRLSFKQRLGVVSAVTLFLCFDLILFGAYTRLSDSGLGCPDWPGCYGFASPLGAGEQIDQAAQLLPTGPVTLKKAWIEMIHRYAAMTVGLLILVMCVTLWWEVYRTRVERLSSSAKDTPDRSGSTGTVSTIPPTSWLRPTALWCTLTLFWVLVQGLFGALTVSTRLYPAIVSLHLVGGMMLLTLLCVQTFKLQGYSNEGWLVRLGVLKAQDQQGQRYSLLRGFLTFGLGIVWMQMALGAWVSTNYAVLACQTFPLCQGEWWPVMNVQQGFEIWRPLGFSANGEAIDFSALTAIHVVHRLGAAIVLLGLSWVSWRLHTRGHEVLARALMVLLVLQILSGVSNVVLEWPLLAALLHVGGAASLVLLLTWSWLLKPMRDVLATSTSGPH
jgi:cytochrome c oxidase assembly protein subunit 15